MPPFVGTVTAIAPARWNSKDGQPWCAPVESGASPIQYRDVTVKISQVLHETDQLKAKAGDELVIRTLGDGTDSGPEVAKFSDGSALRKGQLTGRYEVGRDTLVLLSKQNNFPTEEGTISVNMVVDVWRGTWQVDQGRGQAVSVQPERTVPFGALMSQIAKERNIGRQPERDEATKRIPVEK